MCSTSENTVPLNPKGLGLGLGVVYQQWLIARQLFNNQFVDNFKVLQDESHHVKSAIPTLFYDIVNLFKDAEHQISDKGIWRNISYKTQH